LTGGAAPPPLLKVPTLISWDFFTRSPCENRNDIASVASAAARFPAQFPQISLSVISRDESARDATLSIFNDLQAAGSRSNLVGRWEVRMQKRRLKPSSSEFADRSLREGGFRRIPVGNQ
jgi:hypothetical protein